MSSPCNLHIHFPSFSQLLPFPKRTAVEVLQTSKFSARWKIGFFLEILPTQKRRVVYNGGKMMTVEGICLYRFRVE